MVEGGNDGIVDGIDVGIDIDGLVGVELGICVDATDLCGLTIPAVPLLQPPTSETRRIVPRSTALGDFKAFF
jgi:hypothetical protein